MMTALVFRGQETFVSIFLSFPDESKDPPMKSSPACGAVTSPLQKHPRKCSLDFRQNVTPSYPGKLHTELPSLETVCTQDEGIFRARGRLCKRVPQDICAVGGDCSGVAQHCEL